MFAKINNFFFRKYENVDFVTQLRVKILLSICLVLVFVLLILTVTFVIQGEKDLGILLPLAVGGLTLIVGIIFIKYGFFYIVAHAAIILSPTLIWVVMLTESCNNLLARLDTVAIAIGFISFTALLVSRHSTAIIGYVVANILIFLGCTFYIQRQLAFSNEVMFEYVIDSIIGMATVGVVSFLVFSINKRALKKADESTKIAEAELEKNLELNRTLELKVLERTEEIKAAMQTIRELAIRDELTSLFNRRHLMELLEDEKNRSSRGGGIFCLAMLDIDHFKNVNDMHGHLTGDDVLKAVAITIQTSMRNTDFCGRYGGEEFILVYTQTNTNGAVNSAERLRSKVECMQFPDIGPDFRITVSLGLTEYHLNDDVEKVISRADAALYLAKGSGRNRVEFSG